MELTAFEKMGSGFSVFIEKAKNYVILHELIWIWYALQDIVERRINNMAKGSEQYGNDSISQLKGADRVRKRPAVIFGSDGLDGCEHAVFEILSNSIDEAREGHGDLITLTYFEDHSIEVEDFGRGCPMDYNPVEKRYNWELVFCELYAGGKYKNDDGGDYDDIKSMLSALRESTGWKINFKGIGKSLEIRTAGQSAHGAKPEQGENAISILMNVLSYLNFASDDVTEFIRFYNDHIGFDLHGERMGCSMEDEQSGPLVWNVGMIDLDPGSVRLTVNVRYPVTAEDDQVYDRITSVITPYDLGIIKGKHQPPLYVPADDPMIVTLMDIYRRATGDEQSQPLVIGGGTYARAMDGIVAFGARFPGKPELGHQKNEKIPVDDLVLLAQIYAEAIVRLAGEAAPENAKAETASEE